MSGQARAGPVTGRPAGLWGHGSSGRWL